MLTVFTGTEEVFDAYYYGYGDILDQYVIEPDPANNSFRSPVICTVIDYKDDSYRAKYQQGRFHSGLYCAEIEEYDATNLWEDANGL